MTERSQPYAATFTEAIINISASGDTTVVAAAANKTTKVYKIFFVVAGATTITFKDGASALTGAITQNAGGSFILDFDGNPWFTGSVNTNFILNSSSSVQISGRIYYEQTFPTNE